MIILKRICDLKILIFFASVVVFRTSVKPVK